VLQLNCGVDEAGRGPLAGPVFAAAVILNDDDPIDGLRDSKILSERARNTLAPIIKTRSLAWCIASASVHEIDQINILQATMLAMSRAIEGLAKRPQRCLIDGNRAPKLVGYELETIVKGDSKVAAISAASILAKTARDAFLLELHQQYPMYAFDQHKGYGTVLHLKNLNQYGPCIEHRRSFSPVRIAAQVRSSIAAHPSRIRQP
jgi:ribonuclease HII